MSLTNDAVQRAKHAPKSKNGTGFVWLVVGGGILVMGILLSSNSRNGSARLDQSVPVQARTASEPRPAATKPAVVEKVIPVAASKPAFRLQAVFFSATRPSAMINGRTVGLKDSVGEFHVAAISTNSVTLVSPAETQVLRLAH